MFSDATLVFFVIMTVDCSLFVIFHHFFSAIAPIFEFLIRIVLYETVDKFEIRAGTLWNDFKVVCFFFSLASFWVYPV